MENCVETEHIPQSININRTVTQKRGKLFTVFPHTFSQTFPLIFRTFTHIGAPES